MLSQGNRAMQRFITYAYDFSIVIISQIYIHCIQAALNAKLSNSTLPCVIYLTPIPAKIPGCSLWNRSVMLGSAERRKPWNYFWFFIFSNLCDHSISMSQTDRDGRTDGRTDGQTDGPLVVTIPRSATSGRNCLTDIISPKISHYNCFFFGGGGGGLKKGLWNWGGVG